MLAPPPNPVAELTPVIAVPLEKSNALVCGNVQLIARCFWAESESENKTPSTIDKVNFSVFFVAEKGVNIRVLCTGLK